MSKVAVGIMTLEQVRIEAMKGLKLNPHTPEDLISKAMIHKPVMMDDGSIGNLQIIWGPFGIKNANRLEPIGEVKSCDTNSLVMRFAVQYMIGNNVRYKLLTFDGRWLDYKPNNSDSVPLNSGHRAGWIELNGTLTELS